LGLFLCLRNEAKARYQFLLAYFSTTWILMNLMNSIQAARYQL